MNAIEYNKKLDADLTRDGIVDDELLLNFLEAYRYDAATTVNWLCGKLGILSKRLSKGKALSFYDIKNQEQVTINSVAEFNAWTQSIFLGIKF